ncbi:hypothetical protein AY600_08790 [Phormidium willei BDU 130791]|nr:hypothetical protein AY600_08790 [Phormidium willei BDU 130791]
MSEALLETVTPSVEPSKCALPLLRECAVSPGERWIYSAGFNVACTSGDYRRIDCELDDLRFLLEAGARVAILSHQGSRDDNTVQPQDHAAAYLSKELGRRVRYFEAACGPKAEDAAQRLRPGEAAVFGNTRMYVGEQTNCRALSGQFARLGHYVALGGFSKAHRTHASNVGLLRHLPGYLANGVVHEMARLNDWAGYSRQRRRVAVLGGVKKEKVGLGLEGFTQSYDVVVPTGTVLVQCLAVLGFSVGASNFGESPEQTLTKVRRILGRRNRARILFPERLVVARGAGGGWAETREIRFGDPVPGGFAIVDIVLDDTVMVPIRDAIYQGGRVLLAGTPGLASAGFRSSSRAFSRLFGERPSNCLVVGGDSVADLAFVGPTSVGGGSALELLATGNSALLSALRAVRQSRNHQP